MEQLIPITITVADRSLRIKVTPAEEESVRKTIKLINEKVLSFKQNFAGKDMQDYVTMALVWFATQPSGQIQQEWMDADFEEDLRRLDQQLDKGIQAFAEQQSSPD